VNYKLHTPTNTLRGRHQNRPSSCFTLIMYYKSYNDEAIPTYKGKAVPVLKYYTMKTFCN